MYLFFLYLPKAYLNLFQSITWRLIIANNVLIINASAIQPWSLYNFHNILWQYKARKYPSHTIDILYTLLVVVGVKTKLQTNRKLV